MKRKPAVRPAPTALINRRTMIQSAAGISAGALALAQAGRAVAAKPRGKAVKNGRINQSIVQWCFELFGEKWNVERTCQIARELGCKSVELVGPEHYPTLNKYGLTCAIGMIDLQPHPPVPKGFNNPAHWDRVIKATRAAIDAAAAFGVPSVICFTGYSAKNPADPNSPHLSREEGARNCVAG